MYLINGKVVEKEDFHIPIEDMLVWRGDGIFEAIQLHEGFPFGIDFHLDRLSSSAEKLNLEINIQAIREWILNVSSHFEKGYVRTIISRGEEERGSNVYVFHQPLVEYPEEFTLLTQKAPWHPAGDFTLDDFSAIGVKSTSYALNMKHTRFAKERGYTDALLLSRNNIVLEGPTFSICWIKKDKIFTPSLNLGILDSVTRKYLFSICKQNQIDIEEVESSVNELVGVDAAFLISTAKHAIPVCKIDDIFYSENELLNRLQDLYGNLVQSEKANFSNK